jgi:hypothetical protein
MTTKELAGLHGIAYTESGQPYPYADRVYAGTVQADTADEARQHLARARCVGEIREYQDSENWHMPYFREFSQVSPGVWKFRIIEAYTG